MVGKKQKWQWSTILLIWKLKTQCRWARLGLKWLTMPKTMCLTFRCMAILRYAPKELSISLCFWEEYPNTQSMELFTSLLIINWDTRQDQLTQEARNMPQMLPRALTFLSSMSMQKGCKKFRKSWSFQLSTARNLRRISLLIWYVIVNMGTTKSMSLSLPNPKCITKSEKSTSPWLKYMRIC